MCVINSSVDLAKVSVELDQEKEPQAFAFSVANYIPKKQEDINNDIKSRLIEISYPIKEKKLCKDFVNKITTNIDKTVKTLFSLDKTPNIVEFKSDITETIAKEIDDINLKYQSQTQEKKIADINVILETIQIYFLYCIEKKINQLQKKQDPDQIEFLRISKLIKLFQESFNLSSEEITVVRYKTNSFLKDKQYVDRLKTSFKQTKEFSKLFKSNYKDKDNIFNRLFDEYTKLITSKKNILVTNLNQEQSSTSDKLSYDDLSIALNTMYFFASSEDHIIACENLRKELDIVVTTPIIQDTLEIIDQEFTKFAIADEYPVINYAEVNKTIENLVGVIKNTKIKTRFINTILNAYLFNKIDEYINKIVDCDRLDTNLKVIVLSQIINKCNTLGLNKHKQTRIFEYFISYYKNDSYKLNENLSKLLPKFNLAAFIANVINIQKPKYSDKLLELLKNQNKKLNKIVLNPFSYSELLDVLNFEVSTTQNLVINQTKFNLTNIYEIIFNKESQKNVIKQEEFLVKSILKFENILHEKINIKKNRTELLSMLDICDGEDIKELEFFFNSLFEDCKKSDEVSEIAKDKKMMELYGLISREVFYKKLDTLLTDLVYDETIDVIKRLKYINYIESALKGIFGEQYYLQRNEAVNQIKNAKLTTVNLDSIIQLDFKKNTVFMRFYKKFNHLIQLATEDVVERCNNQEIEESIQVINSIYTEQTKKFFKTRNKSVQDLTTAFLSYKETIDNAITEVNQLTKDNSVNFKKLIEKNKKLSQELVTRLDKFNNHYLKIVRIKDNNRKITAKNSFFLYFQLLFNSICLLFENIKYRLFVTTTIKDEEIRKFYEDITKELYNYQQKDAKASFIEKYFSNINMHQVNKDIQIANFKGSASLFLNSLKDSIADKANNTTTHVIKNVTSFISNDGTNMNIFSCLSFLNLAVDKLLEEGKENFDELDLIKAYYQLLNDFNSSVKQPQFLNNDTLLKFDKNYLPQISTHNNTSKQNVTQLKLIATKFLASIDLLEDKSQYTGNKFANFTVNMIDELVANKTENSPAQIHEGNISLMRNILALIMPHITSENNLSLLNDSFNCLISSDTNYNLNKLTVELSKVLQNLQEHTNPMSSEYITDTTYYLSQLVSEL